MYDKDSISLLPKVLKDDHLMSMRTAVEGRPKGSFTISKNKAIKAESSHLGRGLYSKLQDQYQEKKARMMHRRELFIHMQIDQENDQKQREEIAKVRAAGTRGDGVIDLKFAQELK